MDFCKEGGGTTDLTKNKLVPFGKKIITLLCILNCFFIRHSEHIVRITRNTYIECINEFEAQLWDGIFENSRVGKRIMTEIEETKYYEKNGRYYKKSYYQTPPSDNWIESSAHRISKEAYMKVTAFDDGEGENE